MTDLVSLAKELSSVGFPTLMVAILYGSYRGWWVWGRTLLEMRDDYIQRLSKAEQAGDRWQAMALRATGLAEDSVAITKKNAEK